MQKEPKRKQSFNGLSLGEINEFKDDEELCNNWSFQCYENFDVLYVKHIHVLIPLHWFYLDNLSTV